MGKPTGFMEYTRQAIPERDPEVRTKDWEDYTLPLSDEEVQKQGPAAWTAASRRVTPAWRSTASQPDALCIT